MAIYLNETPHPGIRLGVWKIEEDLNTFRQLLTEQEWEDATESITSDKRKTERCAVRALLHELTGQYLPILYTKEGAPYIRRHPFYLSISHTHGYAAVILHAIAPAGIDIETLTTRPQTLASRFLNEQETQGVETLTALNFRPYFYCLAWSAKESLFKMAGQRLVDFRASITLETPAILKKEGVLMAETKGRPSIFYFVNYRFLPGLVLTYTFNHEKAAKELTL